MLDDKCESGEVFRQLLEFSLWTNLFGPFIDHVHVLFRHHSRMFPFTVFRTGLVFDGLHRILNLA